MHGERAGYKARSLTCVLHCAITWKHFDLDTRTSLFSARDEDGLQQALSEAYTSCLRLDEELFDRCTLDAEIDESEPDYHFVDSGDQDEISRIEHRLLETQRCGHRSHGFPEEVSTSRVRSGIDGVVEHRAQGHQIVDDSLAD